MPVIEVKVKPNARSSSLERLADGTYLAQLKAPPVDGQANEELVALLARHFGCAKAAVVIKSGGASRSKRVVVPDGAAAAARPAVNAATR
jgi:uncharacterized protein (TIGR00251 family)